MLQRAKSKKFFLLLLHILFVEAHVAPDACRQSFGAYAAVADFITGPLLKGRGAVDRSLLETGSFRLSLHQQ